MYLLILATCEWHDDNSIGKYHATTGFCYRFCVPSSGGWSRAHFLDLLCNHRGQQQQHASWTGKILHHLQNIKFYNLPRFTQILFVHISTYNQDPRAGALERILSPNRGPAPPGPILEPYWDHIGSYWSHCGHYGPILSQYVTWIILYHIWGGKME